MITYYIQGCSPSIIKDLFEPVKVNDETGVGFYEFNELPVAVIRTPITAEKYDVVTCDKDALTEIVQRHLKRINLEIKTIDTI